MFSYQLYSSRNFPPMDATFQMLAKAGYTAVEGYGALYADDAAVAATQAGLAATGLTMPTGHFGLGQLETDVEKVLSIARSLKMERLYCPFVMPDDRPTDAAGWVAFGKRLQAAGAPYKAAGYGFGWHNHDFEFKPLSDGSLPRSASSKAAPGWSGRWTWPGSSGAAPTPCLGLRNTRTGSPPPM